MGDLDDELAKLQSPSRDKIEEFQEDEEERSPQKGLTGRLAFAIAAGAIGSGFQHGYNTGVLNAPESLIVNWLRRCPHSNDSQVGILEGAKPHNETLCMDTSEAKLIWGWIVSIYCIGGMIGGSCVSTIASKLGRKHGLLFNNFLAFAGAVILFCAKFSDMSGMLMIGRLVIGINSGINAGISPMYLTEICPKSLRGAVGTVYQLIITVSILLSQVLGLNSILGNEFGWPFLLGATSVPIIFQVVTLSMCPESPKYLLLDLGNEDSAKGALIWLRGRQDVSDEMSEMKAENEGVRHNSKEVCLEIRTDSTLRKPMVVAMVMMLAQQFSGINCAVFYSTSIFESADLDDHAAQLATLGMGIVNVLMTFISLVLVERAGRKTLMQVGLTIMLASTIVLLICLAAAKHVPGLKYLSIAAVVLFVIGFATGPGSIPWFYVTELFNQSARPVATSIAVVTNWSANFIVGLSFEPLRHILGPYVFVIFICLQVVFIIYIYFQVPETKNKTIEEITATFRK